MTARTPRPPSRARLVVIVTVAAVTAVVAPALTSAGGSARSAAPPDEGNFPTTSTNVLVTSPPPTIAPPTTIVAQVGGRQWPVPIPAGCDEPALPAVVFVGMVTEMDYRTARFRIDQVRAGSIEGISANGLIDVRYDIDAKFLDVGRQYLVGATIDPTLGVLMSKVAEAAPLFGGDQVIGRTESEIECPELPDPIRTLMIDGRPVDSGVLLPLQEARSDVARSLLVPAMLAAAIILGLVSLRWFITGLGWSISSAFARSRQRATAPRRRVHPDR